jgi:hypothetical protein
MSQSLRFLRLVPWQWPPIVGIRQTEAALETPSELITSVANVGR